MADLYAVSGETLTEIADAIRSKTGSDDFLTVSAMAAAIESISGGGDLPAGVVYGEFTPTERATSYTLDIHCPSKPWFVYVVNEDAAFNVRVATQVSWTYVRNEGYGSNTSVRRNTTNGLASSGNQGNMVFVDDTTVTLGTYNESHYIRPVLHKYICLYAV